VRIRIQIVTLALAGLSFTISLGAQTPAEPVRGSPDSSTSPLDISSSTGKKTDGADAQGIPRIFRGIELGMGMAEVKKLLAADSLFSYRGDVDVSLLPRPDESLIEVSGLSYIRRAFFQFHKDKLFVMILAINEKEMDHYSIFTTFSAKYGKPTSLSPSESVWLDGTTRVSVERPLAIKYIDLAVFDAIKAGGAASRSHEEILRTQFLGEF
jgi:hypothetical protein